MVSEPLADLDRLSLTELMVSMRWVHVEGASDLPPDRLERVLAMGGISGPGLSAEERGAPQAYLVAQGSASDSLPVHFHTVDQFQYFVHGSGVVGAHDVGGETVHYADALTPYGPLSAGERGMSYLTLRAVHDGGVRYMPESRADLRDLLDQSDRRATERRNISADLGDEIESGRWYHLTDEPDGLRISVVDLPAGVSAAPLVIHGRGAYALVVRGVLVDEEERFEPGALRWLSPAEELRVSALDDSVRVAVLQYPERLSEVAA